jgi:hypothetical protein
VPRLFAADRGSALASVMAGATRMSWLEVLCYCLGVHVGACSMIVAIDRPDDAGAGGLSLDDNQVSDLAPLAGLTALEILSVNDNAITSLSDLQVVVYRTRH